jgi:subtilisin
MIGTKADETAMRKSRSSVVRVQCFLLLAVWMVVPVASQAAEKTVIIGYKQRPGLAQRAAVNRVRGRVQHSFQLIPAVVARLPESEIANLRKNRDIAYVEESALYTAAGDDVESTNSWQVPRIEADQVHRGGNLGTGVKIAVLDTGIDYTHEELDANYRGGYDFVFNDSNPMDDSYNSHGTHVAGIIAAEKNGTGVVGVAPEADIYAVKVLDGGGFGKVEWIIAGIEWAVSHNVDIINMSLSGPDREALRDACDRARSAGVLLVAAGGNSLAGSGPVHYPAAYDSVIAVTSTDPANMPAFTAPLGDELELAAPGVSILSTASGGRFTTLTGTSQAAPCVAGTAGLFTRSIMTDLNGDYRVNNDDVRMMLQLTAQDLGASGRDPVYGFGLVNAGAASLDAPATLRLTSKSNTPADDREVVRVMDGVFDINIRNFSVKSVVMDVYEGPTRRADLSRIFEFGRTRLQPRQSVRLDATNKRFTLEFTPLGRSGQTAEVSIRQRLP